MVIDVVADAAQFVLLEDDFIQMFELMLHLLFGLLLLVNDLSLPGRTLIKIKRQKCGSIQANRRNGCN